MDLEGAVVNLIDLLENEVSAVAHEINAAGGHAVSHVLTAGLVAAPNNPHSREYAG